MLRVIEKHLKLNSNHKCVDAPVSITGNQLRTLKDELEMNDKILGKISFGIKKEEKNTKVFIRSKIL